MDKATGEQLLIDGQPVESSITFTPETACGEAEIAFEFDATTLGGKELVVFETLYYEDTPIVAHEDIDDEAQTIEVVKLYTYATNAATNDKLLPHDADVKIKDTVEYCLKPGIEYTVVGVLMDKQTGKELLINGKPVKQEAKVTPTTACGKFEMFYPINTTNLSGARLVIFESLYLDDQLILAHQDLENYDESVDVTVPAPDTGMITKNHEEGGTINISFGAVLIVAVGVGGYLIRRTTSRKVFFSKK